MIGPHPTGHFRRLMEVLRPTGGVMVLVEGYFDESGDFDDPPGIFCISGYFITRQNAEQMDREWLAVLDKYQLGFFHMVDCAHGNKGFQHLTKKERSEVVVELIALIKKYTIEGISILARASSYKSMVSAPDVYSECANGCAYAVQQCLRNLRLEGDVAYIFEKGHKNRGSAYNYIANTLARANDSITFATKQNVRLLQAADLLAWQTTKYAKDYFYPKTFQGEPIREPRKDFVSLMEHAHLFYHMNFGDDGESMGLEVWPMGLRNVSDSSLDLGKDGPIHYFREDGQELPIVPIERVIGWRPGAPHHTVHIEVEGLQQKRFAVSFDERSLIESLSCMIRATELFQHTKLVPLVSVEAIEVSKKDDQALLRVKLLGGSTFLIHLPEDVLRVLTENLKSLS